MSDTVFGHNGPDENELEAIIEHIPALVEVRKFAARLDTMRWFEDVGERMTEELTAEIDAYLQALGFPHVEAARIESWEDAAAAAESLDWDTQGWEAEEQLRAGLVADALETMDEEALSVALTHVAARLGGVLQEHLENIDAIWDVEDPSLLNAASGAAIQAAHNAALVLAAGGDQDHPFALKFRLFEYGRWPIGLAGSTFNIF